MIELIEDDGVIGTPQDGTILWTTRQLQQFEVTSGAAIQPTPHTGPSGLTCTSMDGERLGRLAWVPPGGLAR